MGLRAAFGRAVSLVFARRRLSSSLPLNPVPSPHWKHSHKPQLDNVLLKSDAAAPSGAAVKLCDFGLARVLPSPAHAPHSAGHGHGAHGAGAGGLNGAPPAPPPPPAAVNVDGAGTVTHCAPELFVPGGRVTAAIDAYAFGIMVRPPPPRAAPARGRISRAVPLRGPARVCRCCKGLQRPKLKH